MLLTAEAALDNNIGGQGGDAAEASVDSVGVELGKAPSSASGPAREAILGQEQASDDEAEACDQDCSYDGCRGVDGVESARGDRNLQRSPQQQIEYDCRAQGLEPQGECEVGAGDSGQAEESVVDRCCRGRSAGHHVVDAHRREHDPE